jgi:membrane-associated protease RseP (regulator of RpoE activity)
MDIHGILAIVFILGMGIFLYVRRKEIVIQKILGWFVYFAMYRAQWGLKAMDVLGRTLPRLMRGIFYAGIAIGFAGMAFISYMIVQSTIQLFTNPELAPGIQPVLPIAMKGVFNVPFLYWIVSIFVIAVVHEFAHGVAARAHNIPVKSSGFAFLGILLPIIPAAFVEPDERKLVRRPFKQQLSVFAAGPLANIILAFVVILAFGFYMPGLSAETSSKIAVFDLQDYADSLTQLNGLRVTKVTPESPAAQTGIVPGFLITAIDGVPVSDRVKLGERIDSLKPDEKITVTINGKTQPLTVGKNPQDATKAWIGVQFDSEVGPTQGALAKFGDTGYTLVIGLVKMLIYIYALSLGIGLFNLLPLGPVDGGRMFQLLSVRIFGEKRGYAAWKYCGFFFLALIFVNLTIGFVR